MRIATWNVNSIKVRLSNLTDWLRQNDPDVVCLQEIKCLDENFPSAQLEDLGYNISVHGQKSYNGVALLSKRPFEDVTKGLPNFSDDQARYLEAVIPENGRAIRVASIYLPNGNPVDGPKFHYKLEWMEALTEHARALLDYEEPTVLAGDYNVIPTSNDVHDPEAWADDALFRPESRSRFNQLLHSGYLETFAMLDGRPHQYTFWDYQKGAWPKNKGIRIDHILTTPQAADFISSCQIDRDVRGWEKASDHVPVWCDFDF